MYGLVVEAERGKYEFTHHTFQEFLAATYIVNKDEELAELVNRLDDPWWEETLNLYSALADATPIIEKCLEKNLSPIRITRLASKLLQEGFEIEPGIKSDLQIQLEKLSNDDDPEKTYAFAETKLSARIRFMEDRLNENREFIDTTLITNMEYKLFLSNLAKDEDYLFPDNWNSLDDLDLAKPVLGIRAQDAIKFCEWLTQWDEDPTDYRIPTKAEAQEKVLEDVNTTYWVKNSDEKVELADRSRLSFVFDREKIKELLIEDSEMINRLSSAMEVRNKKVETSSEILARIPALGLSSTDRTKPGTGAGILGIEMEERRKNRWLLEEYEEFSNLLGFELQNIIHSIIIEGFRNTYNWLPTDIIYSLTYFDIGESCNRFVGFIEHKDIQGILGKNIREIVNSLSLALRYIRTRKWAEYPIRYTVNTAKTI